MGLYAGKLSCGVVFEDSRVIRQPLQIKIGKHSLIRGLDEGILTMRLGEVCVPPPRRLYTARLKSYMGWCV